MSRRALPALVVAAALALSACSEGGAKLADASSPQGAAVSEPAPIRESLRATTPLPTASAPLKTKAVPTKVATPKQTATATAASAPKKSRTASSSKPAPAVVSVTGAYIDYASWEGNRSKYEGTDVVLFFFADWCPKCRDTDASAKAGMPEGLTLVKIDYDDATGLRQAYGVTLQHTFVQVSPAGKAIKKWVGTYSDNSVSWVKSQTA